MKRTILLLTALALALASCGRKGEPAPPGPASQVTYPKAYPKAP